MTAAQLVCLDATSIVTLTFLSALACGPPNIYTREGTFSHKLHLIYVCMYVCMYWGSHPTEVRVAPMKSAPSVKHERVGIRLRRRSPTTRHACVSQWSLQRPQPIDAGRRARRVHEKHDYCIYSECVRCSGGSDLKARRKKIRGNSTAASSRWFLLSWRRR